MKSIELKIKAASLAEESRIIRAQEERLKRRRRKAAERAVRFKERDSTEGRNASYDYDGNLSDMDSTRERIYLHRVGPVRREARLTHLARAFLSGKPYHVVENKNKSELTMISVERDVPKITVMIRKYGSWPHKSEDIERWIGDRSLEAYRGSAKTCPF